MSETLGAIDSAAAARLYVEENISDKNKSKGYAHPNHLFSCYFLSSASSVSNAGVCKNLETTGSHGSAAGWLYARASEEVSSE